MFAVFAQLRFQDEQTYQAQFTNVTGLEVGQFVRIAGVEVGKVKADGMFEEVFATPPVEPDPFLEKYDWERLTHAPVSSRRSLATGETLVRTV